MNDETYLGCGVTIETEGKLFILSTVQHSVDICLDRAALERLIRFVLSLEEKDYEATDH